MKKVMMLSATLLLAGCADSNEPTSKEKTEVTEESSKEVSKKETEAKDESKNEATKEGIPWEEKEGLATTADIDPTVIKGKVPSREEKLSLDEMPIYKIKDSYPDELKTLFKFINAVNSKDRKAYQSLIKEDFGNVKTWEGKFFDEFPDTYIDAGDITEKSGWEEYPNVHEYAVRISASKYTVDIAVKYFDDIGWVVGAIN